MIRLEPQQRSDVYTTPVRQTFDAGQLCQGWVLPVLRTLLPAYALASILILYGFHWGLPVDIYQDKSFHDDENGKTWAVMQI